MWQTRLPPLIATCLIAFFVFNAALSMWDKSTTWDEPFHLKAGIAQLQTGDSRLNADHPPLARLLAAFPTLFMSVDSITKKLPTEWEQADHSTITSKAYGDIDIENRLLGPARLMMLLFSILLGWLIYAWGSNLFGSRRALLPLALYAFCPPLLAAAPLVTTDMAVTTLIFSSFYTWWLYLQKPSYSRLAWVCLAASAAFAAKFTALLIAPLFLVLGFIALVSNKILVFNFTQRTQIVGGGLLIIALAILLGINVIYFFNETFLTPPEYLTRSQSLNSWLQLGSQKLSSFWPAWLPVPLPFTYVGGLLYRLFSMDIGYQTYFMGEAGYGGWPNFFLVLLLIKLPISTLILIGSGISQAVSRWSAERWNILFLLLLPLLLIWTASTAKYQIGVRHILPAFPFLLLLTGYCLPKNLNKWRLIFVGGLATLSAVSTLLIYPHNLMYSNFFAAGSSNQGWRVSITGDDIGQSNADLKRWLQVRNIKEVAYGASMGWESMILNNANIKLKPIPCSDTGELVVIHAHLLLATSGYEAAHCYLWMRLREPDEKIGYSIFIYNSHAAAMNGSKDAQTLVNESIAFYNAGKYQEGIESNTKALQLKPDYALAYNNICVGNNNLARWDEAIKACLKAIELNPNFTLAQNNLAYAKRMAK